MALIGLDLVLIDWIGIPLVPRFGHHAGKDPEISAAHRSGLIFFRRSQLGYFSFDLIAFENS